MTSLQKAILAIVSIASYGSSQSIIDTIKDLQDCVTVPEVCPNQNITFWLYTRKSQKNPHKLDMEHPDSILSAPFKKGYPFKVVIHGYTGHKDYSPNTEIRPALFEKGEFNVISPDYGPIAREPCYLNAVANLKVVGNCTAQLIDFIVEKLGVPLESFHVIGFSLGGQTTGHIANHLKSGKLKRISGLDPALPLFTTFDDSEKLDKSDAEFVDVIHTNILVKGKLETSGHVDFYVNGGHHQPGCDDAEDINSCSHVRAPEIYAESINSKVGFWGVTFPQTLCRLAGNCQTAIMGYYTPKTTHGVFSVKTNDKPPFAQGKANLDEAQ